MRRVSEPSSTQTKTNRQTQPIGESAIKSNPTATSRAAKLRRQIRRTVKQTPAMAETSAQTRKRSNLSIKPDETDKKRQPKAGAESA